MSGERRVRWSLVVLGLVTWAIAIPLLQMWLLVAGAMTVAWGTFGLLTTRD